MKGARLNGKNLWCISIFPPSLFLPKDQSPFPLQPCHQASLPQMHGGGGAIQLTFSPHTQRKTNNCQTNKEKCSSFWETAKTLQYTGQWCEFLHCFGLEGESKAFKCAQYCFGEVRSFWEVLFLWFYISVVWCHFNTLLSLWYLGTTKLSEYNWCFKQLIYTFCIWTSHLLVKFLENQY